MWNDLPIRSSPRRTRRRGNTSTGAQSTQHAAAATLYPLHVALASPRTSDETPADATGPLDARVAEFCRGIATGDHNALTKLYQERFEFVARTAQTISRRDESFALDAAQEVFLRVIRAERALRSISTKQDLDRWLTRLTHSVVIDLLRREHRRVTRERSRRSATPSSLATPDELSHLQSRLAQLEAEERDLLLLRSRGGTLEQIGRLTNQSAPAAHGRIRRAMARLSRLWND